MDIFSCGFLLPLKGKAVWNDTSLRLFILFKEVKFIMTLNLIFVTITIQKRNQSIEECIKEERISQLVDQYKMKYNEIFYRNI